MTFLFAPLSGETAKQVKRPAVLSILIDAVAGYDVEKGVLWMGDGFPMIVVQALPRESTRVPNQSATCLSSTLPSPRVLLYGVM